MTDSQAAVLRTPATSARVSLKLQCVFLTPFILILYAGTLRTLAVDLWENPDYAYGLLVPIIVGFVVSQQLPGYQAVPIAPSRAGLPIILFALTVFFAGTLGVDDFSARFSLCILLTGIVVYLFGWKMLRAISFPLSYLVLMIPLPMIIHNQITFPMQLLASRIAEGLIGLSGVPVFREGNLLRVPFYTAEVAQACSGIRSLLSLLALGVAYSYFAEERIWMRITLIVLMIPIAIFTNAVRIMTACLLGYKVGPEWAEGFVHALSGWLIFVVALIILFAVHYLLSRVVSPRKAANV
jgi:exosortase